MIINNLIYVDKQHYDFIEAQTKQLIKLGRQPDVYFKCLVYLLGLCEETRGHFNRLFDMEDMGICIESLEDGWQTGTTRKITRLAFNLWNGCAKSETVEGSTEYTSNYFVPDEIFCCCFQEFFFEAIRLRFPEYTYK